MRRSNRLKNTSAGIIDNEVNASTFAVSTEYCDANACTPSGYSGTVTARSVVFLREMDDTSRARAFTERKWRWLSSFSE